jgi:hypothetical protein
MPHIENEAMRFDGFIVQHWILGTDLRDQQYKLDITAMQGTQPVLDLYHVSFARISQDFPYYMFRTTFSVGPEQTDRCDLGLAVCPHTDIVLCSSCATVARRRNRHNVIPRLLAGIASRIKEI